MAVQRAGFFNATMKSGTNQFHGSAYGILSRKRSMRASPSLTTERTILP
jgi:hypothetical protein